MSDEILDDIDFQEGISDEEMEYHLNVFIKKRSENYIEYWKNPKTVSFDFLKMMIGVPWLFYRKMNLWGFALMTFVVLTTGLEQFFLIVPIYGLTYFIFEYESLSRFDLILYSTVLTIVAIISGLFSKSIYLKFAESKILKRRGGLIGHNNMLDRHREELGDIGVENAKENQLEILLGRIGGVKKELPTAILLILLFYLLSRVSTGMNTILTF